MNKKAFYNMSYGVYVTTSTDNGKPVGCITNSNTQITSSPATVSVSVNHDNYTAECIEKSGLFGFTVLSVDSDPEIIGKFGFFSSKDTDKFSGFEYDLKEGGTSSCRRLCICGVQGYRQDGNINTHCFLRRGNRR